MTRPATDEAKTDNDPARTDNVMTGAWIALAFVAVCSVIILIFFVYQKARMGPYQMDHLGQTGDFIGGLLNPVIGGATVFLVFLTLRLQKAELNAAKLELAASRATMDAQNKAIEMQRFEQTFFSWLNTYSQIFSDLAFKNPHGFSVVGREALDKHMSYSLGDFETQKEYSNLSNDFELKRVKKISQKNIVLMDTYLTNSWDEFRLQLSSFVEPLTKTFLSLLAWIDAQKFLNDADKVQYAEIIKSQLSQSEIKLLINFTIWNQSDAFTRLTLKYKMFEAFYINSDEFRSRYIIEVGYAYRCQKALPHI
ncbi:putative phage abortive infection protein [Herbaspirillum lusitanum]|uniref:Phage abortive infection protein n=1 Tax=Herbaspirillum lusitanum TaxID=213312 RepID=A0ABW9AC60_9BURK